MAGKPSPNGEHAEDARKGAGSDNSVPREVLPIPDRQYKGDLTYDAKDPARILRVALTRQ